MDHSDRFKHEKIELDSSNDEIKIGYLTGPEVAESSNDCDDAVMDSPRVVNSFSEGFRDTKSKLQWQSISTEDLTAQNQDLLGRKSQLLKSKSLISDSVLNQRTSRSGLSKILYWDPWMQNGRSGKKKEKLYRTGVKNQAGSSRNKTNGENYCAKRNEADSSVSELLNQCSLHDYDILNVMRSNPPLPKMPKIVRFQTDVTVLLYGYDSMTFEEITEPLKKEQDQQERNKELRKEMCPEGHDNGKHIRYDDYMAAWAFPKHINK